MSFLFQNSLKFRISHNSEFYNSKPSCIHIKKCQVFINGLLNFQFKIPVIIYYYLNHFEVILAERTSGRKWTGWEIEYWSAISIISETLDHKATKAKNTTIFCSNCFACFPRNAQKVCDCHFIDCFSWYFLNTTWLANECNRKLMLNMHILAIFRRLQTACSLAR